MADQSIFTELAQIKSGYFGDRVEIIDGLPYSQWDTIKTVEFYSNDKYMQGNRDELGREKPFFNINTFRVNTAVRATDFDVKDIQIQAEDPDDDDRSFVLQKDIQEWMKQEAFAKTLNEMGQTRARYGGLLIKKKEDKDDLHIDVVQWKNVITDQIDVIGGAIIELHYMSPLQLSKKRSVWDNVEEAIKQANSDKESASRSDETTTTDRVEVFEIHGEFPKAYLKEVNGEEIDEDDWYDYTNQVYFLVEGDGDEDGMLVLFAEEEDEKPYKYISWREVPGRGLGIGVVEEGFEAQVWTNDSMMNMKNAMELAGKVVLKSNSKTLAENLITDVDTGSVIPLDDGEDVGVLNLTPSSLPQFERMVQLWDDQYDKSTSNFIGVTGEQQPSGTPFRSVALQSQQAGSHFDYRREEMGIFLQEVVNDWIIPFLTKKLNREHFLTTDFSESELRMLNTKFAESRARRRALKRLFNGEPVFQGDFEQMVQEELPNESLTNQTFLKIPKDYYKNIKARVQVVTSNETRNKAAALESLSNIMVTVAQNPQVLDDPTLAQIFSRIIELSGADISPFQIRSTRGRAAASPQENQTPNPAQLRELESQFVRDTEPLLPDAQQQ